MNQKTITNQILEQKNFTLNSTLNYLFNISNMKKLFSYLLISSMVVLSSCTNYDDQFDDLNSQITSLKSQIEGFSSLSSGLTALQGTVASLQSAVAQIPTTTTDVSGLEASVAALQASLASASTSAEVSAISTELAAAQTALADAIAANGTAADTNATDIAALQTSLEAVQATLAELKTALDSASTTSQITTLTTALAAVQSDLTDLLNQNNIYSTAVSIIDDATLDFADALGAKLNIVNQTVTIIQTADMDAVKLQTVMNRIKTVTQTVSFTATADGITTTPSFDNLTSVTTSLTIDQEADVTLPKLKTVGALDIKEDPKVTSISAPLLESFTSLTTTSYTKVDSYVMSSLKRFPAGAFTLTVDSGTVDFSNVVTTDTATPAAEKKTDITINGATIVKAPKIVTGKLLMNSVSEPNFPLWEGKASSIFLKAKKVVLPALKGSLAVSDAWAPKATYFHMIGNDGDNPDTASDDESYLFPSYSVDGNTTLETLIIGGTTTSVTVKDVADLTSFTITGATHSLTLDNNDSMSSYTLGHTSKIKNNDFGNVSHGDLTIKNHSDITSVSAAELDDIAVLTIFDNIELTTLDFPKLNSLGTDNEGEALEAGDANVNIYGNKLSASSIQLPSAVNILPAVDGKITSTSGLTALSTYIKAAVALRGTLDTKVEIDEVEEILDADGDPVASGAVLQVRTATGYSDTNKQTWDGTAFYIVSLDAGDDGTPKVDELLQRSTYGLNTSDTIQDDDFISIQPNGTALATVTFNDTFKNKYGILATFASSDIDTWAASAASELNAQLDAGSYAFDVEIAKDFGTVRTYTFALAVNGVLSSSAGRAGVVTYTYGNRTLTSTVGGSGGSTVADLVAAVAATMDSDKFLSGTLDAAVSGDGIAITPKVRGVVDVSSNPTSFEDFTFNILDATDSDSTSSFLPASVTVNLTAKSDAKGYRLTVINNSTDLKADNLENYGGPASFTSFSEALDVNQSILFQRLVDQTNISGTNNSLQVNWEYATKAIAAGVRGNTATINFTTWM